MTLRNKTNATILATEVIIPKTLLDQSLGLLKYKTPTAMLLHTRFGIHTFGMRYPIDVLILDKNKRVVVLKKNMKPNRIFVWNTHYETVLELPSETIEKTNTQLKDELVLSS